MQDSKARRLGRGLSSLLNTPVPVQVDVLKRDDKQLNETATVSTSVPDSIQHIQITHIQPNKYQPRRVFDDTALEGLADSIRQSGLLQPVIVRRAAVGEFELIAGERRWRAAQRAGLETIPALVREVDDRGAAEWAVVENVQREDLGPLEKAHALRALCDQFGMTHAQVAERVGVDRTTVTNTIRLTELEPVIAQLVDERKLSAGHARALLAIPAGPVRVEIAERAAREEWSVRRIEGAARSITQSKVSTEDKTSIAPVRSEARAAVLQDLERQLSQHLGTKVTISADASGERGRLLIEFYGIDHFDGLLNKIGMR